jgi:hypothetical protein
MKKYILSTFGMLITLPVTAAEPWQNIALGSSTSLTFDGSLRERYEWTDQRDLAANGGGRDDTLMQRLLLGTRFTAGDYFSSYVQFGSSIATPRQLGRKPTDDDHAYLGQGYVDFRLPTQYGNGQLRIGRQEIPLGSLHLMGTRDGPNVRRSFDAVRASWQWQKYRLDAFMGKPIELSKHSFDDKTDNSQKIWGLYGTIPPLFLNSSLDVYTFGFQNNDSAYSQGRGSERRYTLGSRLYGAANGFDWDNEAAWQWGEFNGAEIRAWSASTHAGYTFSDTLWTPRIGGKAGLASGDKNTHDGRLNTFNAMYPKLPYLTENGLVAPANLMDIHPEITIKPIEEVTLDFSFDAMWRQQRQDGFYLGPMKPVRGSEKGSRFIGNQYQVEATWTPKSWLQFKAAWAYFDVSSSLQNNSGLKDMNFVLTQATLSF